MANLPPLQKIPYPNNMGVVRYVLAFGVVLAHFNILSGSNLLAPLAGNLFAAVGGFFALSGFLMYGSYLKRPTFKDYIWSRIKRLLPAYWVTVIGFALVLSLFSTLSPLQYFLSPQFWKYLVVNLSFANFLEPTLPGVFTDAIHPTVNGSLWTMKVEWATYLSVPLFFMLIRKLKGKPQTYFFALIGIAIIYRIGFSYLYSTTGKEIYSILGRQFIGQLCYFYIGALIYHYLPLFLRYKWPILLITSGISLLSNYIPYYGIIIQPFSVSILVIWFSIIGKWGTWECRRDNVSYNIYLVHFPVIQIYVSLTSSLPLSPWVGFGICCAATVGVAFIVLFLEKLIRRGMP